jgi:hypothetical protein
MTEKKTADERGDEMERALARTASWALPAAAVAVASVVGLMFGAGPAILVLAAGALVGVIALMWASLRTLGGDAPLAEGLVEAARGRALVTDVAERKRRVLRALKDLEHEHEVGKIDDADYAKLSTAYRAEAKGILREMDADVSPYRERAEQIAAAHLKKKGLAGAAAPVSGAGGAAGASGASGASGATAPSPISARTLESNDHTEPSRESPAASGRLACPECSTSNEPDAAFCKKCGTRLGGASAEAGDAS